MMKIDKGYAPQNLRIRTSKVYLEEKLRNSVWSNVVKCNINKSNIPPIRILFIRKYLYITCFIQSMCDHCVVN